MQIAMDFQLSSFSEYKSDRNYQENAGSKRSRCLTEIEFRDRINVRQTNERNLSILSKEDTKTGLNVSSKLLTFFTRISTCSQSCQF